jgi:hypothetical protein
MKVGVMETPTIPTLALEVDLEGWLVGQHHLHLQMM